MENFRKNFSPPENGLQKLRIKLAERNSADRKELWVLQSASFALALIALVVWLRPPVDQSWTQIFSPQQETARLELPNSAAGVHLFWILR